MKRIDSLQQLRPYGVDVLTGESDSHSYRVLCDLSERGKRIIERVLDTQLTLHDPWNSGTKDEPSVGSILIPYEFVPCIAAFALLSDRDVTEVWLLKDGSVLGFGVPDIVAKEFHQKHCEGQVRKVMYSRTEDRNLHLFTGRTA
jgi:hypothetical protein